MSGLPDVPAARVIEAIESLLFQAEAVASWETVRSARRLLGTLLPEEPGPQDSTAAVLAALEQVPKEEPPPRPLSSPRQSPKPRGQPTGKRGTSRYQLIRDELARRATPATVADVAKAIGHPRQKVGISLANMATNGEVRRTAPGTYTSA